MNRGDLHRQALVAAWDAFIQAVEAHDDGFTASAEPAFCSQAIGQLRSPQLDQMLALFGDERDR